MIDGGFLKPLFRKAKHSRLQAVDVSALCTSVGIKHAAGLDLLRVYYYDSPPLDSKTIKPVSHDPLNFKGNTVYTHQQKLFKDLKKSDFVSVREGTLVFRGWKLKKKTLQEFKKSGTCQKTVIDDWFAPNIQQKGVDTKLGLDMAWIAFDQVADRVVIITGDSDFVPAIKAARRNAIQVILCTLGHGISLSLEDNVDVLDESLITDFIP